MTSGSRLANVRLDLSNKAENVLLVRQALSGLAEALDLDPVELNDLSTAVSEACNNVVLHAYEGEQGPLEVEIYAAEAIEVVVRDKGIGIQPQEANHEEMVGGIGLPVIRALTHEVEFNDVPGGGTEVRMRFETGRAHPLELQQNGHQPDLLPDPIFISEELDRLALAVGPPTLARSVLPRVLSALAARAHFSTDRISDAQLLADSIVAQAGQAVAASRLHVEVDLKPREMQLRIGPLRAGSAESVREGAPLEGLGSVLERLSEAHEIEQAGSAEMLRLRLAEPR